MKSQDAPPGSTPRAGAKGELFPPTPKGIVSRQEGREAVLTVIKYFMKKHHVPEITRVRRRDTNNITSFTLFSDNIALRVSSTTRRGKGKMIETISIELLTGEVGATRGGKVLDVVNVHIDVTSSEGGKKMMIDKIWESIMWSNDFLLGELFCWDGWVWNKSHIIDFYSVDCHDDRDWDEK